MGIAIILKNVSFEDFGIGKVTPSSIIPIEAITINGYTSVVGRYVYYTASFFPANTSQRSVIWEILEGNNYATINSSTGELTINSTANNSKVIIRVSSVENPSISNTLALTLTYHLDTYGENLTQGLSWSSGYYAKDYSIKSSSVTYHTNPIQVFKDDILFCKVMGRGMRPIIECQNDLSSKKYGIFVSAADYLDSQITYNYAYHVSANGYVSFCSKQSDDISFWRAEKMLDIAPSWIDGYIDLDGNIQSSSVTKHTEPFFVSAHSIIVVETAGTGFTLVSLTASDGVNFTPILKQVGGRVTQTGDFVVSPTPPIIQPKTPNVQTEGTWYQGVSNPTNTPVKYAVYIESDCYVSVCAKQSLSNSISIYKAGTL